MPNKRFLEEYPLYRKFEMNVGTLFSALERPAVNLHCRVCGSNQTFNMDNQYYAYAGPGPHRPDDPVMGTVTRATYRCASCGKYFVFFDIKFDTQGKYVMKVGQEPPWQIAVDKTLAEALGDDVEIFKKGLICESQGYGIGAFAYYRRIVEDIIGKLLDEIQGLLAGEELELYAEALQEVKKTTVTREKISIVKDLLPPLLRPEGLNPLGVLHDALSVGIHQETDGECLELAAEVKAALMFLVNQIANAKSSARGFTASMRRLLDKKSAGKAETQPDSPGNPGSSPKMLA